MLKNLYSRQLLYFILILSGISLLLLGISYVKNINIFDDFRIEINHNKKNVSDKYQAVGISYFNRKIELKFINNGWENEQNWYFKKILIIPKTKDCHENYLTVFANQKRIDTSFQLANDMKTNEFSSFNKKSFLSKLNYFIKSIFSTLNEEINQILVLLLLFFILTGFFIKIKKTISNTFSRKGLVIISYILICLFLINIVYLSSFLIPCGEDYTITHDVISYKNPILYYYQKLDGRFFTNFTYIFFNPLWYKLPLWFFKLIPSFLVFLMFISLYYLLTLSFLKRKEKILYSLITTMLFFTFVTSLSSALFFMGAAYHYTIILIITSILVSVSIKYYRKKHILYLIAVCLLLFIFHGTNEFSFMISPFIMGFIIINDKTKLNKISDNTYLIFGFYISGALFNIMAPGNYNRIFSETAIWFDKLTVYEKLIHSFSQLIVDNLHFLYSFLTTYPILLFLALFWLGFAYRSNFPRINFLINSSKLFWIYFSVQLYIVFFIPLPFYLSGIWTKDASLSFEKNYHNIQYFLLLLTNIVFINSFSVKYQNSRFIKTLGSTLNTNFFYFLLFFTFIFSKSIFRDTISDVKSGNLANYYNEAISRYIYLTTPRNSNSITVNQLKYRPLITTSHDFYNGRSIIGETAFDDYMFKTIIGVSTSGDTTYKKNHLQCLVIDNINKTNYQIKNFKGIPIIKKNNKITIIRNFTFYNQEKNTLETVFYGINHSILDSLSALITIYYKNKFDSVIYTKNDNLVIKDALFFKRNITYVDILNHRDRELIFLCFKGEIKTETKVYKIEKLNKIK